MRLRESGSREFKADIEIMALYEKMDHILVENLEQIARTQQDRLLRLMELCEAQAARP